MPDQLALVEAVRNAIEVEKLEAVLRAAGATHFRGQAADVLREVAAAEAARKSESPLSLPALDAKVIEAARAAIAAPALRSVKSAGLEERVARELGAIAIAAADVARAEARSVCHSCVAVGAARLAAREAVARAVPEA